MGPLWIAPLLAPLLWLCDPAAAPVPGLTASRTTASPTARWITPPDGASELPSKRFFGEPIVGPAFKSGEEVELILVDGDQARIREGSRYGWVPASALSTTPPLTMPSMPELLPPGGNPLLGGLKPLLPAPGAAPAPAPPSPQNP